MSAVLSVAGSGTASAKAAFPAATGFTAVHRIVPASVVQSHTVPVSPVQLRKVGVTAADLPAGYTGGLTTGGETVKGQVTLDMCGTTFASEAKRTARYQVEFATHNYTHDVSSEAVLYRAGGAAQALAEVRKSAAHCPTGLVRDADPSMPLMHEKITIYKASGLPADSISLLLSASDPVSGLRGDTQFVYLVRGPVLVCVYVQEPGAAARILAHKLGVIVAARLAKTIPTS